MSLILTSGVSIHYPALIKSVEISEKNTATYYSVGKVAEGSLNFDPIFYNTAGNVPVAAAYNIDFSCKVVDTSTEMRTFLNELIFNDHDTKITDVNDIVYNFESENFQLYMGVEESGDFDNPIYLTLTGSGFLTQALFTNTVSGFTTPTCT